jgi:hypothetical protein
VLKSSWWLNLGIFLLILMPRLINLGAFTTFNEAAQIQQTFRFWQAIIRQDWFTFFTITAATAPWLHWLSGLGLAGYAGWQPTLSLIDLLVVVSPERVPWFWGQLMRWPIIVVNSLAMAWLFTLLRSGLGLRTALISIGLLAFDPILLGHTRLLSSSAMLAVLALLILLLLARAIDRSEGPLLTSALLTSALLLGLALATDQAAWLLVGIGLGVVGLRLSVIPSLLLRGYWLVIAGLIWFILWPAAWRSPLAAMSSFWPHNADLLSLFHHPTRLLFYTTPIVWVGLIFWLRYRRDFDRPGQFYGWLLLLYALAHVAWSQVWSLPSIAALLPALAGLAVLAGFGWQAWLNRRSEYVAQMALVSLIVVQLAWVLPYAPYYLTAVNPLLGGHRVAAQLFPLGQGEGLDQAGAWLNTQLDAVTGRVGSAESAALAPYFLGQLVPPTDPDLDYLVIYRPEQQRLALEGKGLELVHIVQLNGLAYVHIYRREAIR